NAKTVITLGSSELESQQVSVKNNHTREEVKVSLEAIKTDFENILKQLNF
ncbi:His/Gly/Thr/Pro-type tRNA ligase C-terminal domain-containing protein, partial [Streptococcus suis]